MALYTPPAFREADLARLHQLIREHPLGLLISADADIPQATPLPFHLEGDAGPFGTLQGHFSRANDHWRAVDGKEVLVVFQGADAYVSPTWYAAKAEHGKVVPTWNYVTVQVRGVARVVDDPEWVRGQIARLTSGHEASREPSWHVTDAPAAYIDGQVRGIVGVEIAIRQIDGKWKVSQNRSMEDRRGVVAGLEAGGEQAMADLVRERMTE